MSDTEAPVAILEEDLARARWYALVSRLFAAPPDTALLNALAHAPAPREGDAEGPLVAAWRGLQTASRDADAEKMQEEFDALFVSVGKAPVTLYTSSYAASHAPDRHLLALRSALGHWGLGRQERVFESEDHVSGVLDGMRWIIEQGRPLTEQREYFMAFIEPAIPALCSAITKSAGAAFYRVVAMLAVAVVTVEKQAFDMDSER